VPFENKKSRAIPKRLGFKEEGIIRQTEWLYDRFVDHVVYGMLIDEWQSLYKQQDRKLSLLSKYFNVRLS